MKAKKMKTFRLPTLALGMCLLVIMAYKVDTHSQAKTDASQEQTDTNQEKIDVKQEAADAHFEAGLAAYQANNLPLAFHEFLAAAKKGHADSQYNMGIMYEQGIGVRKDDAEAFAWYSKSAEQGNSDAQFNLGVFYENGRGTKVNFAKANKWYRKASVKGDAMAIGNLGMLYVRGDGVKENKIAGVALLLLSATEDPSPENQARKNIAATRGLTTEMVGEAQTLSAELSNAQNLLVPLDEYLKE